MKKPRIFIAIHYLEIGGAETSLIGLFNALDPERVDVDLFVYAHRGSLMQLIPDWVNLLPEREEYRVLEVPLKSTLFNRKGWLIGLARTVAKIKYTIYRLFEHKKGNDTDETPYQFMAESTVSFLPQISDRTYDLAINFCGIPQVVSDKVNAATKITWLHTDYSAVTLLEGKMCKTLDEFDKIISISADVTTSFLKVFPAMKSKIIEIENILSPETVRQRSKDFNVDGEMYGDLKLLSVGRYCHAKNYDNLPYIAKMLVEEYGFTSLKWYIIGYGDDSEILSHIEKSGMEKHVILLGKKKNPYPYIGTCDIYVQPSRFEGKSVTVREAQILFRPVAVTSYPTAQSQIRSGVDGVIVPLDNAGCARGLADFIRDESLRMRISANLESLDFGNRSEVDKIYSLIK